MPQVLSMKNIVWLKLRNYYFLINITFMICVTYILQQIYSAMLSMGIYYMMYVLNDEDLFPIFSWAINIPLIIALLITPWLVAKWQGLYKLNLVGYAVGTIGRALVVVAAYMGSVPLMLVFTAVAAFGMGPWQGDHECSYCKLSRNTLIWTKRNE